MYQFIVLMYHNFSDKCQNKYTLDFKTFISQLDKLLIDGFVIEGFDGLLKRFKSGEWPERYVLITIDDGHRSNLIAAEILGNKGAGGTFFITKHYPNNQGDYLNQDEIFELSKIAHLGSHSVTHSNMTKLDPESLNFELANSKLWLEEITGQEITTLSVPGGFINSKVVKAAIDNGYELIGNSNEWWNNTSEIQHSRIVNRIAIRNTFSNHTLYKIINKDLKFFIGRKVRSGIISLPKRILFQ